MEWYTQTYTDSQAITAVSQSAEHAKFCKYSLKLTVDLVGQHPNKSKGEALVDVQFFDRVKGEKIPLNLEGKTITMWVYVLGGAMGERSSPNGVQVFVKDRNYNSQYGAWLEIPIENEWFTVKLTPSKTPSEGVSTYIDKPGTEFEPTQIIIVGFKIGAGGQSNATYNQPIYIDGVNW
jgi:hypothetical protein